MSLDTLWPQLENPQRSPSAAALAALSEIGDDERERFLAVWRTLGVQRRRDIIDRLADIAEDNVELDFSGVFKLGLFDSDVQVRAESVKGLWEYEAPDVAHMLLSLLRDPEAIVRGEAALGLGRYLTRAELLEMEEPLAREVEAALRGVFHDEAELLDVRARALEALGVRGHGWVAELIDEAYASGDRRLAISAVHAMGRSADVRWLPTVLEELESDDGEMRFEAAAAAGAIGDETAIARLAPLTHDDDAEVQDAAIAALGEIGGPSARSVLIAAAEDESDERVLAAVSDALSEADFVEDPLGFKLYLDRSVADDLDDVEDE